MELQSINKIKWQGLKEKKFTPSPVAWEDQVFYFLMLDRFSNNKETGYIGQ